MSKSVSFVELSTSDEKSLRGPTGMVDGEANRGPAGMEYDEEEEAIRGPVGMEDNEEEEEATGGTTNTGTDDDDDDDNDKMLSLGDGGYSVSTKTTLSSFDSSYCLHRLVSERPGDSKVERMADKIQTRLDERVPVTLSARKTFLKRCRQIAVHKNYPKKSRVKFSDIKSYHQEVKKNAEDNDAEGLVSRATHFMGVLSDIQCLREVLGKAEEVGNQVGYEDDDDFFFQEFNFFHTVLVSRWPFLRYELLGAFSLVLSFYILTPILFCVIMGDAGICPQDADVPGWVSSLYFASTTLSTVGYGDLTVEKDEGWKVLIGMLYMLTSTAVALLAFSAAAESAVTPIKWLYKWIADISPLRYPEGPLQEGEFLYQRIRKVKIIAFGDVFFQFFLLNFIGVAASQGFIVFTEDDVTRRWNWLDSMYFAVQTTTTIGYGDYAMPDYMRIFQIFYLSLATYFTGNALGRLAALKEDLEKIRRYHSFERREVNKHMMHYLSSTGSGRVDQYEFVIASLLNLGKVDSGDIKHCMDKFRSLEHSSGGRGYITISACPEDTELQMSEFSEVEGVEGA